MRVYVYGFAGPNGYPVNPIVDCVDPVAPEDWLATYTNTIEEASFPTLPVTKTATHSQTRSLDLTDSADTSFTGRCHERQRSHKQHPLVQQQRAPGQQRPPHVQEGLLDKREPSNGQPGGSDSGCSS